MNRFLLPLLLISLTVFSQSDTTIAPGKYSIVDKYPYYQYCKNCKIESPRPGMACGHSYRILFLGYAYDNRNWIDIGYSTDIASCYPDKGAHLVSVSVTGTTKGDQLINGLKLSYFRDHLLGLQFYFLSFGFSAEGYTDYKKFDYLVRPEIRIGDNMFYSKFLTRMQFSYGYNFPLSDHGVVERGRHQFSINLRLLIRGWVS